MHLSCFFTESIRRVEVETDAVPIHYVTPTGVETLEEFLGWDEGVTCTFR